MTIVWDVMRAVVNGNDNKPKSGFTLDMISPMTIQIIIARLSARHAMTITIS